MLIYKTPIAMKKKYILLVSLLIPVVIFGQNPNPNFFPVAVWLQDPSNAAAYKNAGINIYVGLWNELDAAQLTKLTNSGMKVICEQNAFGLTKLNDTLIYGWALDDEPDNAQWNATTNQYDPCIDPSVIINQYNTVKANDSSRPVYLNLGQGVSYTDWVGRGTCTGKTEMYPDYNNGYLKGCDIASFDIYPVNNSDAKIKGNLWYVPKGIDSLISWSSNKKPVWCWIECTKINTSSAAKPTVDNVKSEVWMALIHGVKGYGYFCHQISPFDEAALLHDAPMLAAVTAINNQVTSLATVLNSPSTFGYANVSSSNTAIPIDIMTKNQGGANYIFAVAMRSGSTTATFTVNSGVSVEVLGENRTLTISGGKFTDSFSNYGVHLYKIMAPAGTQNMEATIHNIRLYPNPFSDILTIELNDPMPVPFDFILYDLYGKVVYEKTNIAIQKFNLRREVLSSGMYMYLVKNKKQGIFSQGKVVVE